MAHWPTRVLVYRYYYSVWPGIPSVDITIQSTEYGLTLEFYYNVLCQQATSTALATLAISLTRNTVQALSTVTFKQSLLARSPP